MGDGYLETQAEIESDVAKVLARFKNPDHFLDGANLALRGLDEMMNAFGSVDLSDRKFSDVSAFVDAFKQARSLLAECKFQALQAEKEPAGER